MLTIEAGAFGFSVVLFAGAVWLTGRAERARGERFEAWAARHGFGHVMRPAEATVSAAHPTAHKGEDAVVAGWYATRAVSGRLGAGTFRLVAWRARRARTGRRPGAMPHETVVVDVQTPVEAAVRLGPRPRFQIAPHDHAAPTDVARRFALDGDAGTLHRLMAVAELRTMVARSRADLRVDWQGTRLRIVVRSVAASPAAFERVLTFANAFAVRAVRALSDGALPAGPLAERPLALRARHATAVARRKPIPAPS